MNVPRRDTLLRYALAGLRLAFAALGFAMLPAHADCGVCQNPPPPPPHCNCNHAPIVVPSANVPAPNVVTVNNRAAAQASAQSFAVAVARTSDVVVRTGGMVADVSVSAGAMAESSEMFTVVERGSVASASAGERMVRVQAVCRDAGNVTHAALQTFAGEAVTPDYAGELYRCVSDAQTMRVSLEGHAADCVAGQALWYEHAQLMCKTPTTRLRTQAAHRFGTGNTIVLLRDAAAPLPSREVAVNAAMAMEGGVGGGLN